MPVLAAGISFPGQPNSDATLDRSLRLAKFGGRVLAAFMQQTQLRNLVWAPSATGTQTFQYPAIGRITAAHHVTGDDVGEDGPIDDFNHTKRAIQIDDELIAATFLGNIEAKQTEYEFLGIYLDKIGEALARTYEERAFISGFRAARHTTANTTNLIPTDLGAAGGGGFVGSIDLTAGGAAAGAAILGALFAARTTLLEKEVPESGWYAFMSHARYAMLVQNRELIDRDFNGDGNGMFFMGKVMIGAGFALYGSNRMPTTNIATNPTGAQNTYTGNFTQTVALAFQTEMLAMPTIQAPMAEMFWDNLKRGWFLLGSMIQGVGPLRYECAVELSAAAAQPAL